MRHPHQLLIRRNQHQHLRLTHLLPRLHPTRRHQHPTPLPLSLVLTRLHQPLMNRPQLHTRHPHQLLMRLNQLQRLHLTHLPPRLHLTPPLLPLLLTRLRQPLMTPAPYKQDASTSAPTKPYSSTGPASYDSDLYSAAALYIPQYGDIDNFGQDYGSQIYPEVVVPVFKPKPAAYAFAPSSHAKSGGASANPAPATGYASSAAGYGLPSGGDIYSV
ncbi:hypothetical protein GGF41_006861, partial [Coemansia sp. RSA 2531]